MLEGLGGHQTGSGSDFEYGRNSVPASVAVRFGAIGSKEERYEHL
jgi:hypothetical protein